MVKVFISYAHEDYEAALRFYRELNALNDIEPWLDKECLQPGMRWRPAIRKAIREADFFVALLSNRTGLRRGFINTELNQALEILQEFPEGQIFIVPVRLDNCDLPHHDLREIQYVDFFPDWDSGMAKVLKSFNIKRSTMTQNIEPTQKMTRDRASTNSETPSNLFDERSTLDYEYQVAMVDLDFGLSNLAHIAQHLDSIQHYFHFTCPTIRQRIDPVRTIEGFSNFVLDLVPTSFYEERQYLKTDLVACITKYPLAFRKNAQVFYNYFSYPADEDERFMFVSASDLALFTNMAGVTFEKGIAYLVASQLVQYFTQMGFHSKTRGCLMDFCAIRVDIVQGLQARKFCSSCAPKIQNEEFKQAIEAILKSEFRIKNR
jgi:hypothetical protein